MTNAGSRMAHQKKKPKKKNPRTITTGRDLKCPSPVFEIFSNSPERGLLRCGRWGGQKRKKKIKLSTINGTGLTV